MTLILSSLGYCLLTIVIYQSQAWLQKKSEKLWLNPMLLSILVLIAILQFNHIDYQTYREATQLLSQLLEPAVVALGYPLYQQLHAMRKQWQSIVIILCISVTMVIIVSYLLTLLLVKQAAIAISLSLKSITTPIGLALTQQLNGNSALTAFAIILAGLFGAIWGVRWLTFIRVTSPKAQGLAIGTASHALGTATISQLSYTHAAYGSLALILSAMITAIIAPTLIGLMQAFF